jgi:hypothetical protein
VPNGEELIADGNVALRIERKRRKKVEEIGYPNLAEQSPRKPRWKPWGWLAKFDRKEQK